MDGGDIRFNVSISCSLRLPLSSCNATAQDHRNPGMSLSAKTLQIREPRQITNSNERYNGRHRSGISVTLIKHFQD